MLFGVLRNNVAAVGGRGRSISRWSINHMRLIGWLWSLAFHEQVDRMFSLVAVVQTLECAWLFHIIDDTAPYRNPDAPFSIHS